MKVLPSTPPLASASASAGNTLEELGWQGAMSCTSSKSYWCTVAALTSVACSGETLRPPRPISVESGLPAQWATSPPMAAISALLVPASAQPMVSRMPAFAAATVVADSLS